MTTDEPFSQLLQGLRAGEAAAVTALVHRYESFLRRTLRRRLAGTSLQALADSADLCQSVFAAFLIRFMAGEFQVATADDLTKLLLAIARRKFARLRRREFAARRDRNRTRAIGSDPALPDPRFEEPSVVLTRNELLSDIRQRMAVHERALFELRQAGHSWDEIAERLNEPAARLRKRYSRAVRAVCDELRLELPDE